MRILNGRVLGLGWDMMERLLGWEHLDCRSERGVVEVMGWLMGWLMGLAFSQLCVVVREPSAVRWAGMSLAFSQLGGVGVREGEGVFLLGRGKLAGGFGGDEGGEEISSRQRAWAQSWTSSAEWALGLPRLYSTGMIFW